MRVLHQKHNMDGNPIGLAHANPLLDTCVYKVHFPNMRIGELAANAIAVDAKCDINCNHHIQLNAIMDYQKNQSMDMSWNKQVTIMMGRK